MQYKWPSGYFVCFWYLLTIGLTIKRTLIKLQVTYVGQDSLYYFVPEYLFIWDFYATAFSVSSVLCIRVCRLSVCDFASQHSSHCPNCSNVDSKFAPTNHVRLQFLVLSFFATGCKLAGERLTVKFCQFS